MNVTGPAASFQTKQNKHGGTRRAWKTAVSGLNDVRVVPGPFETIPAAWHGVRMTSQAVGGGYGR